MCATSTQTFQRLSDQWHIWEGRLWHASRGVLSLAFLEAYQALFKLLFQFATMLSIRISLVHLDALSLSQFLVMHRVP